MQRLRTESEGFIALPQMITDGKYIYIYIYIYIYNIDLVIIDIRQ